MKTCENCSEAKACYYRGIINPCDTWRPNSTITRLRAMAQNIVGLPMTFKEGQFVDGCTTSLTFSPKQESWLRGIHKRMKRKELV